MISPRPLTLIEAKFLVVRRRRETHYRARVETISSIQITTSYNLSKTVIRASHPERAIISIEILAAAKHGVSVCDVCHVTIEVTRYPAHILNVIISFSPKATQKLLG
jgi:hypothetical protein